MRSIDFGSPFHFQNGGRRIKNEHVIVMALSATLITRVDVLTVMERIETVFSVLSGGKDSSYERKLSAFPKSPEVPFLLLVRSCQVH